MDYAADDFAYIRCRLIEIANLTSAARMDAFDNLKRRIMCGDPDDLEWLANRYYCIARMDGEQEDELRARLYQHVIELLAAGRLFSE